MKEVIFSSLGFLFLSSTIGSSFAQEKDLSFGERLVKGVFTALNSHKVEPVRSSLRLEASGIYVPAYFTYTYYGSTTCSGPPSSTFSNYVPACTWSSSDSFYTQTFIDLSNYTILNPYTILSGTCNIKTSYFSDNKCQIPTGTAPSYTTVNLGCAASNGIGVTSTCGPY